MLERMRGLIPRLAERAPTASGVEHGKPGCRLRCESAPLWASSDPAAPPNSFVRNSDRHSSTPN